MAQPTHPPVVTALQPDQILFVQAQAQWQQALRGMQESTQQLVVRPSSEKLIWVTVTAITNLFFVPFTFRRNVLLKKHLVFETILSAFTILSSFLYHFCESMDEFDLGGSSTFTKGVWLGKGRWHRLDNISAIMCFVVLLVQ